MPKRFLLTINLTLLITLLAPIARAQNKQDEPSRLEFSSDGGFCLSGALPQLWWEPGMHADDFAIWGSYCDSDSSTGRIESEQFLAPASLKFEIAGYAGNPGLRLVLRNVESQQEFDLSPAPAPGDRWRQVSVDLPQSWIGSPVQIIGEDHSTKPHGWFAFTAPQLPYSSLTSRPIRTDIPAQGFCRNGVYPKTVWPAGGLPAGTVGWGSYCSLGDYNLGWINSEPFAAGSTAAFYVAGYPGGPGLRLAVENLNSGHQLPLQFPDAPGNTWKLYHFLLPAQWKGQPVRLLAEDKLAGPKGWVAFAHVPRQVRQEAHFAFRMLGMFLALFVLTMLPAAAACILAALRGVKRTLDLTTIALLTIGLVGYGAFWSYFLNHALGLIYSYVILLLSAATVIRMGIRRRRRPELAVLRRMLVPAFLVFTASLFIVSLGFVYGRPDSVQDYAVHRFAPPLLSIDNFLPKMLADEVFAGNIAKPFFGGWLSSDRPPLQAGMAVWHYAWTRGNRDLAYEVLGIIFQLTFLAGLWAFLEAAGINRKATALVMAAALFSGFTFVNSFYVWPKLLPVAYLLLIAAYFFTQRYPLIRADWRVGCLVGAAAALAMLCHGGSIFALLGIGIALLILRRLPGRRFLFAAGVTAILLYLPWSLYQRYFDPPGDRLVRMHLAGSMDPGPEKLSRLFLENYEKLGWSGTVHYKIANLHTLVDTQSLGQDPIEVLTTFLRGDRQQRNAAVASLRHAMFLQWFWSLDLFCIVPLVCLVYPIFRRPRTPEFRQSLILWLCTGMTVVVWCLLIFGPGGTIVHQGCYFTEIAAFAAGVLGLWALSPLLAQLFTAAHVVFTLVIYVFLRSPEPVGVATYFGPLNTVLTSACVLAAATFVVVLWKWSAAPLPCE